MLCKQFRKHHLFRKEFGTDDELRRRRIVAGAANEYREQQKEASEAFHPHPIRHATHHATRNRRSNKPSRKSASNARSAAGMAPARITASLTIATPRKINVPRPPAPMAAAMV